MLAGGKDRLGFCRRLAGHAPVLLRQEFHGEMHAFELAARHRQIARFLGAAGEHHGIVVGEKLVGRDVEADMSAVMENDAFGFHLHDAALDVVFLHLEIGNAVTE